MIFLVCLILAFTNMVKHHWIEQNLALYKCYVTYYHYYYLLYGYNSTRALIG